LNSVYHVQRQRAAMCALQGWSSIIRTNSAWNKKSLIIN
jgi:hypothetical protein